MFNWLGNTALWVVKTFAPSDIGDAVTDDVTALQKAIPDIIAAEPQIEFAAARIEVAIPHLIAAFKILWPAFQETLTMIQHHTSSGQTIVQAIANARRKIAAVTPVHVDQVEQWTGEK